MRCALRGRAEGTVGRGRRLRLAKLAHEGDNHLLRLRRPAKLRCTHRDYLFGCLAVRLPSWRYSDANTNRHDVSDESSHARRARDGRFADGRPLRIKRFDEYWISAEGDDIQYEFNRSDGTLTYAGSTVEDSTAVTIVGSGRCGARRLPLLR